MFARADGFASLSVAADGESLDDVGESAEECKPLEKRALDNNCQHVSTTGNEFAGVAQLVEQGIHKPSTSVENKAHTGEFARQFAHDDPDLAELVDRWPDLDEPIKAVILALIRTTKPNHPTRNAKEVFGPRSL